MAPASPPDTTPVWRRALARTWRPTLWYLFGVLVYHFLKRDPLPTWRTLPAYFETVAGFVLGSFAVYWWRERRRLRSTGH